MEESRFTFIDLFAGIGGFHLAMHSLGGKCVFASEIDEYARKTYEHNFKEISPEIFDNELYNSDIRKIAPEEIPDFDVLCAGFPCQPFSQAGFKRGFEDNHNSERGNLFFNIAEIIDAKRPKAFFLENVRGLATHDNGKTFKIILDILRKELGYSVYYKIVKASDYGLPQHRPRTFIIGFRDDNELGIGFSFPPNTPLKYTMSDVLGGVCDRKVGFTLRVGGRGSNINDRRNWDSYYRNGQVYRIGPEEGKRMQGFPESFEFPVNNVQAMKQLGNSVAVDAIRHVGRSLVDYMESLSQFNNIGMSTFNKGEWSEPYTFLKLIKEKKLYLSSKTLVNTNSYFTINKVTNDKILYDFIIFDGEKIIVKNKITKEENIYTTEEVFGGNILSNIRNKIVNSSGTFEINEFSNIEKKLKMRFEKGGDSNKKSDILVDFKFNNLFKEREGLGIKSYLGAKPTLLNASSNTNFIYSISNFDPTLIDVVNSIDTTRKIQDRIDFIEESGGIIKFERAEKDVMNYNLMMVDADMPQIVGLMLLTYYGTTTNTIESIVNTIYQKFGNKLVNIESKEMLVHKVKKLLFDYTCGFFPGKKWDGNYTANGTIVVDEIGELHGFHIVDIESFRDYLFETTKFDTPSSSRHGFGKLYLERDGKLYFKLNMQIRFK